MKARRLGCSAPRLAILLGTATFMPGCVVSASRYEAAAADAEHQAALRAETEEELAMTRHALVDTRSRLRATEQRLHETAIALSRAEHQLAVTTREHGATAERADQLHEELERAAENHEVLSERLRALESQLEELGCEIAYGETTTIDCGELLPDDEERPAGASALSGASGEHQYDRIAVSP